MTEVQGIIEVLNIEKVEKGNLLAVCDVRIIPWKMTLVGCRIFEKAGSRWVTLPSSKEILADNSIKYTELVMFDTDSIKRKFTKQVTEAVDQFIAANPDLKSEPVISAEDSCPF